MIKKTLLMLSLLLGFDTAVASRNVIIEEVEVPESFKKQGGIVSLVGAPGSSSRYSQMGDADSGCIAFNQSQTLSISDLPVRVFVDVNNKSGQSILIAMEDFDVLDGARYKVVLSDFNVEKSIVSVDMGRIQ